MERTSSDGDAGRFWMVAAPAGKGKSGAFSSAASSHAMRPAPVKERGLSSAEASSLSELDTLSLDSLTALARCQLRLSARRSRQPPWTSAHRFQPRSGARSDRPQPSATPRTSSQALTTRGFLSCTPATGAKERLVGTPYPGYRGVSAAYAPTIGVVILLLSSRGVDERPLSGGPVADLVRFLCSRSLPRPPHDAGRWSDGAAESSARP